MSKCFESSILTADGQEIDAANLKTSAQLAKEDWGTETVGVQFANGINAIIAYNPKSDQQPFNNQFSATEASIAILYDVSGHKNPNTLGKDVNQNANVRDLGCMINPDLVGGMCISKMLAPDTGYSPMTLEECNQAVSDNKLGIRYCQYDSDYWAGAVRACGGVNNIPEHSQLMELAKYLYNTDTINTNTYDLSLDTAKAAQFLSTSPNTSISFSIWVQTEYSGSTVLNWSFGSVSTHWASSNRDNLRRLAVCVDN